MAQIPHRIWAVHDKCRHTDARQQGTHVDIHHRPGVTLAWPGLAASLCMRANHVTSAGSLAIVGAHADSRRCSPHPSWRCSLAPRLAFLAGHRPGVVGGPRGAGDRRVHDQRADPLRVLGGELRADEPTLGVGEQRRAFAAGGVEHRKGVVYLLLDCVVPRARSDSPRPRLSNMISRPNRPGVQGSDGGGRLP